MPDAEKRWDELIRKLFPPEVADRAKEIAHKKDDLDDLEELLDE